VRLSKCTASRARRRRAAACPAIRCARALPRLRQVRIVMTCPAGRRRARPTNCGAPFRAIHQRRYREKSGCFSALFFPLIPLEIKANYCRDPLSRIFIAHFRAQGHRPVARVDSVPAQFSQVGDSACPPFLISAYVSHHYPVTLRPAVGARRRTDKGSSSIIPSRRAWNSPPPEPEWLRAESPECACGAARRHPVIRSEFARTDLCRLVSLCACGRRH
jgi:hypothetical protein